MNILKFGKTLEKLVIDNSPLILTAVGVVGTVTTAVLTRTATIKACSVITVAALSGEPEPTNVEVFKKTWLFYVPPVAAGTVTIGAIVMAQHINMKRAAALVAGYGLLNDRFDEYKNKVEEKFGLRKEDDVRTEIAQDQVNGSPPNIIITDGKTLFRDEPSGRYFESTMEDVKSAQNDLNHKILKSDYAVLSDLYELLGLPPTSLSEEFGWNSQHDQVEILYNTVLTPTGKPCITMDYNVNPVRNGGTTSAKKIRAVKQ